MRVLESVGSSILGALEGPGRFLQVGTLTVRAALRPPYDVREWVRQMAHVGVASIPIVTLTCMFTGMVMTLQIFQGFSKFKAEGFVGSIISLAVLREIAPILTALMVTARAGSSIAAELGNMRVTEQVDALVSMATDPIQYLVVPRVIAGLVMVPALVLLSDAIAIGGGRLVAVQMLGANPDEFDRNTFQILDLLDLFSGLLKATVFGFILTLQACIEGLRSTGGAEGVGRASTRAVVRASVLVVATDFFLSKLMY